MEPTRKHASFLEVVQACDDFPEGPAAEMYYQLYLPDHEQPFGYITPETVEKMPWTEQFSIHHDHPRAVRLLDKSNGKATALTVNAAFQELVDRCIDRGLFHVLSGRHSEKFAIVGARYGSPVWIERFAASLFGLTARGAHLVAYTMMDQGMQIWVPRRAPNIYICPNMLDATVAGGVKAGVSPFQTIIEESDEEASLPADLILKHAKSRGVITHMSVTGPSFPGEKGLVCPDYIYIYDIELPAEVTPKPHDDEVDSFSRMCVEDVKTALLNGEFKPDSGAVLVEFFIRHGVITPENESDLVDISMRLHRRLPFKVD